MMDFSFLWGGGGWDCVSIFCFVLFLHYRLNAQQELLAKLFPLVMFILTGISLSNEAQYFSASCLANVLTLFVISEASQDQGAKILNPQI